MCQPCTKTALPQNRDHLRALVELRKIEAIAKEDGGDPWARFDRIAAELQDLLLLGWDAASRQAIEDALSALSAQGSGDGAFAAADLDAMIAALETRLGVTFGRGGTLLHAAGRPRLRERGG